MNNRIIFLFVSLCIPCAFAEEVTKKDFLEKVAKYKEARDTFMHQLKNAAKNAGELLEKNAAKNKAEAEAKDAFTHMLEKNAAKNKAKNKAELLKKNAAKYKAEAKAKDAFIHRLEKNTAKNKAEAEAKDAKNKAEAKAKEALMHAKNKAEAKNRAEARDAFIHHLEKNRDRLEKNLAKNKVPQPPKIHMLKAHEMKPINKRSGITSRKNSGTRMNVSILLMLPLFLSYYIFS